MLEVTVTYLKLLRPSAVATARALPRLIADKKGKAYQLEVWKSPTLEEYRALYTLVGKPYLWWERLAMADDTLKAKIDPCYTTIVRILDGDRAIGYAEWTSHQEPYARYIAYFGLSSGYDGLGLGRVLMETLQNQIWQAAHAPSVIFLNTCTLDHPRALGFYQAMGFEKSHTETISVPDPRGIYY